MADLIATLATEGRLPLEVDGTVLEDAQPDAITWVSPFKDKAKSVARSLGGFPGPGEVVETKFGRALSVGPDQAMLLGEPPKLQHAAVVDQSDAWTVLALDGAMARDTLARLTPFDLRDGSLGEGQTARSLLGHMTMSITRVAPHRFEIMVFRSMTQTALHEIERALRGIAARGRLQSDG